MNILIIKDLVTDQFYLDTFVAKSYLGGQLSKPASFKP